MADPAPEILRKTPLHALHVALGAKMVPFAGYDMPVHYPSGIIAEHNHARAAAGLFDVSHMGQMYVAGDDAAALLETLVPGDIKGLLPDHIRYTQLTNESGGILDDLMATNRGNHLFLVVNAACKNEDAAHIKLHAPGRLRPRLIADRALLAVQGPQAARVMARLSPGIERMQFMTFTEAKIDGSTVWVSRSGYTGEDGFELSIDEDDAEGMALLLLDQPEVKPIGLGARDSLRLEAGLCLYGHDIDTTTTPVEAGLVWSIGKRRRAEGGFLGADVILRQLAEGPRRRRIGILPEGRAPAREHTPVTDAAGRPIGEITSGGFGPTVGGPVAMGYVAAASAAEGTPVFLVVRDVPRPARIVKLPFVPRRYYRG